MYHYTTTRARLYRERLDTPMLRLFYSAIEWSYNGLGSYSRLDVDSSMMSVGNSLNVEFRTNTSSGRLAFVQFLTADWRSSVSIELLISGGQVQLVVKTGLLSSGKSV